MWKLFRGIREINNAFRVNKYVKRLEYALYKLEAPKYDTMLEKDRRIKRETVRWLLLYYKGDSDAVADGPPETRLQKILAKPTCDYRTTDQLEIKVLYDWIGRKRIEGF